MAVVLGYTDLKPEFKNSLGHYVVYVIIIFLQYKMQYWFAPRPSYYICLSLALSD